MNKKVYPSFLIDPTPSVREHLPSQQFAATVGLGCGSSPFNTVPCAINQTAQSWHLPSFHNYYQPYAQYDVWHTEYTCNTHAAQPVFYPANWESINRPDSDCKSRYEATAKTCRKSQRSVTRGNENLKGVQRILGHPSRSEECKYSNTTSFNKTWDKDRESTMPPQKRKKLDGDSRGSLRVPQPEKQFDEAHMLGSQQSEDSNKQSLNNWNGIHNSYHTEFSGDVTQHVQTITTSKRRENNNGDRNIRQRPGNSELQPTKFLSDDVTDVDTTLLLTIPFKQDKSSLQQTRCAKRNKPANSVYKDYLAESDWAGDSYYRNVLPRIVAVHTIVKDRSEKTQRKELCGAKRLSSNEKKEWNLLLAELSSSSVDEYYEVERKRYSPNGYVYPPLSEVRSVTAFK